MELFCYNNIEADSAEELIGKISEISSGLSGYERGIIYTGLTERERISPTAIGKGVLLPHIRLENLDKDYLFFFRLRKGITYKTPDSAEIRLVFLILSPLDKKTEYLRLISSIVKMVKNQDLYNRITAETDTENLRVLFLENLLAKGIQD